ncbi:YceI family protein [Chromatium okenii]|jgi:polyisoprenoid-binding protein YceI|uniref:YceI family protein n=1 Tax=Chromatium okenii TaxID=61644 RepID=A0A2S7XQG6_9GAMM|nr:YceI family protein [Chromatium okenii]MBV5307831.1 YceI family protein [Chromatium okenii]PQJ95906.1 YceI family protein [Chromatium okenii]PQJ97268.1 YceI family protein [Chromatium okenii]
MRHPLLPCLLFGFLLAPAAHADWTLDPARSQLNFVSIKANNVAEINTFGKIEGRVTDAGQVTMRLALDSVETLIPIRNERMRQFLFETTNYQEAVLRAQIDPQQLANLAVGSIASINAEGTLLLHGLAQPLTLALQVARVNAQTVMVANVKPLIVDAAKFGMTEGVEKLRQLAGLSAISSAVPVTFVITLVADAPAPQ